MTVYYVPRHLSTMSCDITVAPGAGLEPATYGLTVRRAANCATPEGA